MMCCYLQITPQDAVRFLEEVKVELSLLRNRYASTVSNAAARVCEMYKMDTFTGLSLYNDK